MPGMNIKISDEPDEPAESAPLLGEDTCDILALAGYSPEEIAELKAKGIVKYAGGEE
jgi:crotonobetainyl-CoA:carnitine CoA-transferase CaiB-like acyl-CoA transferase